jgi:hypothetical protein
MDVLTALKTNAPRKAEQGQRMWCVPTGLSTTVENPRGCAGCSQNATHNIAESLLVNVPIDQSGGRYGMIPVTERQDVPNMNRIQSALFLWHYYLYGYFGAPLIFNAGPAGDNADQAFAYEIRGVGSGYIVLYGKNPKRLVTGASRVNPEWPLPDPVTGSPARLIWESDASAMQIAGASVEFQYPSVLYGKFNPLISSIVAPDSEADDVEFTAYLGGADTSNVMVPYDATFPPADGIYRCLIRSEILRPQAFKDYQAPKETQFSPRRMTFNSPGVYGLTASDDNGCRVILPGMATDAVVIQFSPSGLILRNPSGIVATTYAGTYSTTIDLTGFDFETAVVDYWAESTAPEDNARQRVIWQGQCSKSRIDYSTSHDHGAGPQHCGETSSTGFQSDLYHQNCWLPGRCSGFSLADESLSTMDDANFLGTLWTRSSWIISQGVPGISNSRNFTLIQKGGASIQLFTGGFSQSVPSGFFEDRDELNTQALGKRVIYTDEDGGQRQTLEFGAFYAQPYRINDSEGNALVAYEPDAFDDFRLGNIALGVSGWTASKPSITRGFPWKYCGQTNLYSFDSGGSGTQVNSPVDSEAYIVAIDPALRGAAEDVLRMRGIYG